MARCTLGRIFTLSLITIVFLLGYTLLLDLHSYKNLPSQRYSSHIKKHKPIQFIKNYLPILNESAINQVETFLFFVGYARSGHSIIASCLDAHSDIILAHEYNLFAKLVRSMTYGQLLNRTVLYNVLYQNSIVQSKQGWRSSKSTFNKKGYNLKMKSSASWHGRFRKLRVIGDKSAGITSRTYQNLPSDFIKALGDLSHTVQVPVKALHVIRNPYDMIATRLLYRFSEDKGRKANFTPDNQINNKRHLKQATDALNLEATAVDELISVHKLETLEVHHADFIQSTNRTMKAICSFLGVKCSKRYLKVCSDAAFHVPHRSRNVIHWTKEGQHAVEKLIHDHQFFKRYSINSW